MKVLWPDWSCSAVTFAPQRGWLAARAHWEKRVRFYDPGSGREEVASLEVPRIGSQNAWQLSPDDRLAIYDYQVLDLGAWWAWADAPEGPPPALVPRPAPRLNVYDRVFFLQTLPLRVVAQEQDKIQTWNLVENRLEHERPGRLTSFIVSPNGEWVSWQDPRQRAVAFAPRLGGEPTLVIHRNFPRWSLFSPDSRLLATVTVSPSKVHLWEVPRVRQVPSGRSLAVFKAFRSNAPSLAFHPSNRLLAVGGEGEVRFYDTVALKERPGIKTGRQTAWSIAFSPDGALMAMAVGGKGVTLVDMEDLVPG
jgi:WD40 repeat protein